MENYIYESCDVFMKVSIVYDMMPPSERQRAPEKNGRLEMGRLRRQPYGTVRTIEVCAVR